jgi:S1-C subfamily serine protease
MLKLTFAMMAAAAALLAGGGCATAQSGTREIAPGVTMTGNTIDTHRGPRLGFTYTGTPMISPDGTVRFADYPVVTAVADSSEAQKAGIRVGDVILQVNGRDGREAALFRNRNPGTQYRLTVRRGTQPLELSFTFGAPAPSQ